MHLDKVHCWVINVVMRDGYISCRMAIGSNTVFMAFSSHKKQIIVFFFQMLSDQVFSVLFTEMVGLAFSRLRYCIVKDVSKN